MFWTFHKMPVIYATYLSAFPTFVPADVPPNNSRSIFDVPLACWIQLCFVRLHRNKMTVITSETIVLYFNLITHSILHSKKDYEFRKKICSLRSKRFLASSARKLGREQKKKERTGEGEGNEGTAFPLLPSPSPFHLFFFAPALTFAQ